jgi:hypothetical protein
VIVTLTPGGQGYIYSIHVGHLQGESIQVTGDIEAIDALTPHRKHRKKEKRI